MDSQSNGNLFKQRWVRWLLFAGIWTIPLLLTTTQVYFRYASTGRQISLTGALISQLILWAAWVILSPFIVWLGRRFPINKQRWLAGLLFHLPMSILFAFAYVAYYTAFVGSARETLTGAWFVENYVDFVTIRFIFDFTVYWVILGVSYGMVYYEKYRSREHQAARLELKASQLEAQLAQAQLQSLKMQLHPHFLFNTLHTIAALVRYNKKETAIRIISGLSELLRLALKSGETHEVTLAKEIEFLERYLEIEQIRFQDRLKVEMKVEPEALHAQVPNLILQPLVENAIRHGVSKRATAGLIQITVRHENGTLKLQVCDDGPGLPEAWKMETDSRIGLANTKARLEKLYGSKQKFEIGNLTPDGTRVAITLPFNHKTNTGDVE